MRVTFTRSAGAAIVKDRRTVVPGWCFHKKISLDLVSQQKNCVPNHSFVVVAKPIKMLKKIPEA